MQDGVDVMGHCSAGPALFQQVVLWVRGARPPNAGEFAEAGSRCEMVQVDSGEVQGLLLSGIRSQGSRLKPAVGKDRVSSPPTERKRKWVRCS